MLLSTALAVVLASAPARSGVEGPGPATDLALPAGPASSAVKAGDALELRPRAWSSADVTLQAVFVVSMLADWNQTRFTIAAQRPVPGKAGVHYQEQNPILGPHPSATRVDLYFLTMTVAHLSVAHVLPQGRWRTAWQLLGLGVQVGAVTHNASMGVGFRF
jgi:hypothetical protein